MANFIVQDDTGGVAGANAYGALAAFKSYHDDRGNDYTTGGYTDPMIMAAIVRATAYLDVRFEFPGQKAVLAQPTLTAKAAFAVLTFTGQPTDGQTVKIGTKTYTFQTVLTNVDGNVFIGATFGASLVNLKNAINLTGTPGTDYAAATTANTQVSAVAASPTMTVTALVAGSSGNLIAATTTVTGATWSSALLAGGLSVIEQTTQWPRVQPTISFGGGYGSSFDGYGYGYADEFGFGVGYPYVYSGQPSTSSLPVGLPVQVVNATFEYALRALSAALFQDVPAPVGGRLVKSQRDKVDVIESQTEYSTLGLAMNGGFVMPAYPLADLMLRRAGLVNLSSRVLVR